MKKRFLIGLYGIALFAIMLLTISMLSSCGRPQIKDVMPPEGVKCKADITMPDGRVGQIVVVDVRIYECK